LCDGCHAGVKSLAAPAVTLRAREPLASLTRIWKPCSAHPWSDAKAIPRPSCDQLENASAAGRHVTQRRPVPSGRTA
jgi:hypothetical protein